MQRLLIAGLLGVVLAAARPASVHAQPSKDNVKRLEAELDKLRGHLRELEAALDKAKATGNNFERKGPGDDRGFDKKKEAKGPFGGDFPRKDGPPFAKKKDDMGPGGGFGPKDGPPFAKKKNDMGAWGKGPPFAKKKDGMGPWAGGPTFERKLDPPAEGPPWMRQGPGETRGFSGPPWMRGGPDQGRGGFGARPEWARSAQGQRGGAMSDRELEHRLDDILHQLEELRRAIHRR